PTGRWAAAAYPPPYQWAMRNDPFVRVEENCILMRQALQYAQVPNALHLYPGAAHGTGLSAGTGAEDWLREGVDFLLRHLDAGK
ncbi:MAG: hypothetical protein LIO46_00030, partial [Clostridiales bacterium]|nr:hypothetical protein [Clostridiales bacterium]